MESVILLPDSLATFEKGCCTLAAKLILQGKTTKSPTATVKLFNNFGVTQRNY